MKRTGERESDRRIPIALLLLAAVVCLLGVNSVSGSRLPDAGPAQGEFAAMLPNP